MQKFYHILKPLLICYGLVYLWWACHNSPESPDPAQLQRRVEVREKIKQVLGDKYHLLVAAATEQQLKRGRKLYVKLCASCHGGRGQGSGKIAQELIGNPSNFTDSAQSSFYSEQGRLYIIRKGVAGTPMIGWENVLTEDDILAVYLYVRALINAK
ncbi:MAG: c-type cytochrome [bacterium]